MTGKLLKVAIIIYQTLFGDIFSGDIYLAMPDPIEKYSPGWWAEWANVSFTITKMIAIVVAGLWTYYKWDSFTFRKESHEEFKRKAELRTDIDPSETSVSFVPARDLSLPVIHKGDLLHANGKIILKNDRPFPIRVEFTKSFFEVEHPVEKLNEIADAGTTPLITNSTSQQWNSNFVKKITETFSDKGLVIEPNGKVQIPLSEFFYLDKKTGNNFFSISFTLKYKLVPINPSDNQEIKNSSKDKTLISSNYFKYENRKISSDRNIICINIEKECEAASRNNLDVYARLESYNIDQRNSLTSFGGQYLIQGGQPSPFGGFNLALPNRLVTPYDGYTGQSSDNPQPAE